MLLQESLVGVLPLGGEDLTHWESQVELISKDSEEQNIHTPKMNDRVTNHKGNGLGKF